VALKEGVIAQGQSASTTLEKAHQRTCGDSPTSAAMPAIVVGMCCSFGGEEDHVIAETDYSPLDRQVDAAEQVMKVCRAPGQRTRRNCMRLRCASMKFGLAMSRGG